MAQRFIQNGDFIITIVIRELANVLELVKWTQIKLQLKQTSQTLRIIFICIYDGIRRIASINRKREKKLSTQSQNVNWSAD